MDRRKFIRGIGSLGSVTALGGGLSVMRLEDAHAQTDYKALVCVFLFGGNDGFNTLVPVDNARYTAYAGIRKQLALPQGSLTQLNAEYGLHPSAAALKSIWDAGAMANILNVGPLATPMTQQQYFDLKDSNDYSKIPLNLFSHSDQQNMWEIGGTDGTGLRTGWGGRLVDLAGLQYLYSFAGNPKFAVGPLSNALALPGPGYEFGLEGLSNGVSPWDDAIRASMSKLIDSSSTNVLQSAYASTVKQTLALTGKLGPIIKQAPSKGAADPANTEISAAFGNLSGATSSNLGRQLYQVAKMIKNRSVLGGNRHLFFVSNGGFDTHDAQVNSGDATAGAHAKLLGELAPALAAFYKATVDLGVASQVTSFTMSDFGRTLKPNSGNGSDHAWGNIHFAMGGAVKGQANYGRYPELVLGGKDEAGKEAWERQGRFIPAVSVDQYAGTLVKWFTPGVNLNTLFPNMGNFAGSTFGTDLGFMKA
jgi:uncharacterized protein (DUF1501 family)